MAHIFLEIKGIRPGVETPADLSYVIRDDKDTTYSISPSVVEWIRGTIDFAAGQPLVTLKNCCFAFGDGAEFVEFDGKGKLKPITTVVPPWFPDLGEFLRERWLINNEMYDLPIVEFIKSFLDMFPDVEDRRLHAGLLFDLQLNNSRTLSAPAGSPVKGTTGNKHGKSTAPKIADMKSLEMFTTFFARLKEAANHDEFPTLHILTGHEDISKVPATYKAAVRTWFRAITGVLPPNNKRVAAGNAGLFCAPIREQLKAVEAYGLDKYYPPLSDAIEQAGDLEVSKFEYKLPV